jgi:hypothetical protein
MAITLLLVSFVSLFLIIGLNQSSGYKETLLKTVLVFSGILVLITEVAGFFHVLHFSSFLFAWTSLFFMCSIYLYSKRDKLVLYLQQHRVALVTTWRGLSRYHQFLLGAGMLVLFLVFVQGVVYPPNNWDSMTYHMARIPNWISGQSVDHYPTHIFRQVYQPPFAEFFIMHVNILQAGDTFSNSVQFFFLLFSLFAILAIADLLGLNRSLKFLALGLAIALPEAILQASATQNDVVASFFILATLYFSVKAARSPSFANFLFLGFSAGLAMLTKGTAYLYLFPMLALFGMSMFLFMVKQKNYSYLKYSILAMIVAIGINVGHYYRNYQMADHVLGINKSESKMYSNETMTPMLLASNILKNIGLHMGPYPVNIIYDRIVYKLHAIAGIAIRNPETNFNNMPYSAAPNIPNHEDFAANLLHLLLGFFAFCMLLLGFFRKKKMDTLVGMYMLMMVLQGVLFCWYLKWQPWHTRLHTPLFMLSVPLICYVISFNNKYVRIFTILLPFAIFYVFTLVIFNFTRPLVTVNYYSRLGQITSPIKVNDERYKKYFANNRLQDAGEYSLVLSGIAESQCKNIGLILGEDDWEYPLFCNIYEKELHPVHIFVSNVTKDIPSMRKDVDCIVSTTIDKEYIEYGGKKFMRTNSQNKHIWFYKPLLGN